MDLIVTHTKVFLFGQIDVADEEQASFKKKPNTIIT